MPQPRVLVVEDNVVTSREIVAQLHNLGYNLADIAYSGEEALYKVSQTHPDLILMDIRLGKGIDGTEAAEHIRNTWRIPIVYLTAYSDKETLQKAKITEPFGYIIKPFDERTLYVAIETALCKHKAEEELARQKTLLTEVFDNIQEGIALVDECGKILFCNPAYAFIVGAVLCENLVGENVFEFFGQEARTRLIEEMKERQHGKISTYELPLVSLKNERKYVHLTVVPRFTKGHTWTGEFVTMLDITQRKRMEYGVRENKEVAEQALQAAEAAHQAAVAANRAKGEFLANMSHEVRSPLNAILGYTRLLLYDPECREEQRSAIIAIQQGSEYLLNLMNQVLDFSKIEAGKITLNSAPFHFSLLVHTMLDIVRGQADIKGIALQADIASDLPIRVQGDETRLRQILLNLLNNAIKFTDQGSITLRVRKLEIRDVGPDRPMSSFQFPMLNDRFPVSSFQFQIEDTGIGISPDNLERIFVPFQQIGNNPSYTQGTGLGLAICQYFLRMMGSELHVKSAVGQGSLFWFEIEFPEVEGNR